MAFGDSQRPGAAQKPIVRKPMMPMNRNRPMGNNDRPMPATGGFSPHGSQVPNRMPFEGRRFGPINNGPINNGPINNGSINNGPGTSIPEQRPYVPSQQTIPQAPGQVYNPIPMNDPNRMGLNPYQAGVMQDVNPATGGLPQARMPFENQTPPILMPSEPMNRIPATGGGTFDDDPRFQTPGIVPPMDPRRSLPEFDDTPLSRRY